MIPALTLAAAAATLPNERVYRLAIHGTPNSQTAVRVEGPTGWLETLCTPRVCAIRRSVMRLSRDGQAIALLHVYRISASSPRSGSIYVRVSAASTAQKVLSVRY